MDQIHRENWISLQLRKVESLPASTATMQDFNGLKDEPIDPLSRQSKSIEITQQNSTRRPRSDKQYYGGSRRTRQRSSLRWLKQQLLLAMALLFLSTSNDSLLIANAFSISQLPKQPVSLTPAPTLVSATTRYTLYLPKFPERNKQKRVGRHILSASTSSATVDDEESNNKKASYKWTSQTLALALPALIGMLVDPLLSMMDTAYVGNLGSSTELAALGACTSIFHLAFNAFRATTAATTSLVGNASTKLEKRQIVKISLSLGLVMGLGVGSFLRILGPWCLGAMGIQKAGPLFAPGLSYLKTRSLAAPAVLAITVSEGAFRGYGDTKIPLLASGTAALVNLLLDPILMLPPLSRGVQGAAAATAASQVGALGVYLWFLAKRKMLPQKSTNTEEVSTKANSSRVVRTILGANLAMVCKQGSLLLAWAYATAKATRIGQAHVAAHQVALSCWLVFALLQDGAGVASQVLLTKVLSGNEGAEASSDQNRHEKLLSLVKYMLKVSILQGLVVTCGFLLVTPYLPGWFVREDAIVRGHLQQLLPHVAGQQLLVSLTLILESLAVGGKQFRTLAVGTALSTILSAAQIRSSTTVVGVWSRGIVGLFAGRLVTAVIGTWKVIRQSSQKQKQALKEE